MQFCNASIQLLCSECPLRLWPRLITLISRWMAYFGGVVLFAIVVVSNLSIFGRSANGASYNPWLTKQFPELAVWLGKLGAVPGDIELVEAGVAFAIFAFFPWFVVSRSLSMSKTLSHQFPNAVNNCLVVAWNGLFAIFMGAVTWQLLKRAYYAWNSSEFTPLLGIPIWFLFAICAFAAFVTAAVASVSALQYLSGRKYIDDAYDTGAHRS